MPKIKTATSLPKRDKEQALVKTINRAYEEEPLTADEKALLQAIREQQRKVLESEN